MSKKEYSLSDINTRAAASRGFELELEYPKGTPIGIYVTVLGDHSTKVENYEVEKSDARAAEQMTEVKGGSVKHRSLRDVIVDSHEAAAVRVIGWRGIKEEYSSAGVETLLKNNPDFTDQILAASRDRANFTIA